MSGGSKTAIFAALGANAGITVAKFAGALITGSSSMMAEAIHSVADTGNQALLLVGQKRSEHEPDAKHPFGYGRNRYFYAFVVALVLFTLGSLTAIHDGINKIRDPEHLEKPLVAIVILVVALGLESFSLRTGMRESRTLKGRGSWWQFIRDSRNPELPVVLLEDSGALIGLTFAFAGVGLTMLTGNPVWDGIGTLAIGVLLGGIAVILIVEMKSLLIGEGATPAEDSAIRAHLVDGHRIDQVMRLRTEYLAPDQLMVAAKIRMTPFLDVTEVADAINDAEARVRMAVPNVDVMYLEPEIYRPKPLV
ncbi:cation diffusion facilitator family transporter [Nocardia sp. NPDC051832]|uniref:cation diffusion facilitator family transporter n=1 Tax=Nocardia sp. NPDC051832 TaxID=3155673 RepID=UPI00343E0AE7